PELESTPSSTVRRGGGGVVRMGPELFSWVTLLHCRVYDVRLKRRRAHTAPAAVALGLAVHSQFRNHVDMRGRADAPNEQSAGREWQAKKGIPITPSSTVRHRALHKCIPHLPQEIRHGVIVDGNIDGSKRPVANIAANVARRVRNMGDRI